MKVKWTREWPAKPGNYWLYGWPYTYEKNFLRKKGEPAVLNEPDYGILEVRRISNGVMHTFNGQFMFKEKELDGPGLWFAPCVMPEPPEDAPREGDEWEQGQADD